MLNHSSHFSGVVGVYSGTKESKLSLGGNDGTKHDINSPMRCSGNHTPSSKSFNTSRITSFLLLPSPKFHAKIFSIPCFASGIFIYRSKSFPAMILMVFGLRRFCSLSRRFMRCTKQTYTVLEFFSDAISGFADRFVVLFGVGPFQFSSCVFYRISSNSLTSGSIK